MSVKVVIDNLAIDKIMGKFTKGVDIASIVLNKKINNGELSIAPPIDTGKLRGSGAVFRGKKQISVVENRIGGAPNVGGEIITIANTAPYASKLHEKSFKPGKQSLQASGSKVGSGWLLSGVKEFRSEFMRIVEKNGSI